MSYRYDLSCFVKNISIFCVILIFFLSAGLLQAQLSGLYTIGSGGSYATFAAAATALNSDGISGPVIFEIFNGTYNEQFDLGIISGSSAANTIIFRSQSGDSSAAILYYQATGSADNYVVRLNGTRYITFEKITLWSGGSTYSRVVQINGNCSNIALLNCMINGPVNASGPDRALIYAGTAATLHFLTVANCVTDGGALAIELNLTTDGTNTIISNNIFKNGFGGVYLNNQQSVQIANNVVENGVRYGFDLQNCDGETRLLNNRVDIQEMYALNMSTCYGGAPPLYEPALIANNFFYVGVTNSIGIRMYNSTYTSIIHNSIQVRMNDFLYARALDINGGSNIRIFNNIFACENNGFAMYIFSPAAVLECDYNNLYSPGNYIAYWGSNVTTLDSLKTVSGRNTHSVSVYPHFGTEGNLHSAAPWLDGRGTTITGIPELITDIDNEPRNNPPDIGADEFIPAAGSTTPMAGTYPIGINPYRTFTAAIEDLTLRGISASVVFDALNNVYNEQVEIVSIAGSSPVNTVTFQSHGGDAGFVTLYRNAPDAAHNYVVRVKGADHLRFEEITIRANSSSTTTYGRALELYGGSDDIEVRNCQLIGSPVNNSAVSDLAVVYSYYPLYTKRIFADNTFIDGSFGIYEHGVVATEHPRGLQITGNQFRDEYTAVFMDYNNNPVLENNRVTQNQQTGFDLSYLDGHFRIVNNQIFLDYSGYGIRLSNCTGGLQPLSSNALVANNFIGITGTINSTGLDLVSDQRIDFCYNNIHINSASTYYGRAVNQVTGSNLSFLNNIFTNTGGGYSYYISTPSAITSSDYNDHFTTGSVLAYWNGDQPNLGSLRAASGMEVHSLSVDPGFVASDDLHVTADALDSAAVPVAGITDDIDGDIRHIIHPDIGADEFDSQTGYAFTRMSNSIPAYSYSRAVWGDYDRDGDLDILISGNDGITPYSARIYRNDGTDFSEISTNMTGVVRPALAWGDYDNDGDLDILLSGENAAASPISRIYTNAGNGVFNELPVSLHSLSRSAVDWGDYDLDGDLDFVLCGATGSFPALQSHTYLYRNDGNGQFVEIDARLPGIYSGAARWGDYDNDGDLDILLTGAGRTVLYESFGRDIFMEVNVDLPGLQESDAAWGDFDTDGDLDLALCGKAGINNYTSIYRNNGNDSFTLLNASLTGVSFGSVAWGDYDNNGYLDLLVAGGGNTDVVCMVYANNGSGVFNPVSLNIPGIVFGAACWGDYDNDADLDILITGQEGGTAARLTRIYTNRTENHNTLPSAPTNLSVSASSNTATFYWHAGSDNETPAAGLNYNLRIGTTTNGNEFLSSHALNSGRRLLPVMGNAQMLEHWNVFGLQPATTYYWSVQAIDNGLAGSTWAQGNFTTQNTEFQDIGISLPGVWAGAVDWGDADNDGDLDFIMCGQPEICPDSVVTIDMITKLFLNQGGNSFVEKPIPLPGLMAATVKWIDYDGDRDLDLFCSGWIGYEEHPDESGGRYIALYQNDGHGNLTEIWTTQHESSRLDFCHSAIGDADNDGDYDLVAGGLNSIWSDWYGQTYNWEQLFFRNYFGTETFIFGYGQEIGGLSNGYITIADYNNDSQLDFFQTGLYENNLYSYLTETEYYSIGCGYDESFQKKSTTIAGIFDGCVAWNDYDNDGDEDVLLSGFANIDSTRATMLYRNDNGSFTQINTSLIGLNESSISWGDCDNDGDADLLLAGFTGSEYVTRIYRNDGFGGMNSWIFSDITGDIEQAAGLSNQTAAWGDYDKDGDLDLLQTGYDGSQTITKIYNNTNTQADFPPQTPTGLTTSIDNAYIYMHWQPALDDKTPPAGLTYNIRIGLTPGGTEITTPLSDLNGRLKLSAPGLVHHNTNWKIRKENIAAGTTIYWSVQSVDPGFKGSPFATEQSFIVPEPPDTTFNEITNGMEATTQGDIQWADFNNDGLLDVILTGYDAQNVAITKIYYNAENGGEDSWNFYLLYNTLPGLYSSSISLVDYDNDNDVDILLMGRDPELNNEYVLNLYRNDPDAEINRIFTLVETGLPALTDGAVAWADYDNDGDQDLLVTGFSQGARIAEIYRNDGSGSGNEWVFTRISSGFIGVNKSMCAWIDLENDGDNDVIICGQSDQNTVTHLYRNDGAIPNVGWVFTPLVHNIPGYRSGSIRYGDVNEDGFTDFFICGNNSETLINQFHLYIYPEVNDNSQEILFEDISLLENIPNPSTASIGDLNNDGFVDFMMMTRIGYSGHGFYGVSPDWYYSLFKGYVEKTVTLGDFNRDHKLDVLYTGKTPNSTSISLHLYMNKIPEVNTSPVAPLNLFSTVTGTSVRLSWDASSDQQTAAPSLTYALRVGTRSGSSDVVSPLAPWIGVRRIPTAGNCGTNTSWTIRDLTPQTKYYWSVQAIDHNYDGSVFAVEDSFLTGSIRPEIVSVTDVPFDGGGKVQIKWQACAFDTSLNWIPNYTIWRGTPLQFNQPPTIDPKAVDNKTDLKKQRTSILDGQTIYWEWMGEQPAHKIPYYSFTCPTLFDSGATHPGKHYFLISAHTRDYTIFYDSEIDSGYSVDNFVLGNSIPKRQVGLLARMSKPFETTQSEHPVLQNVIDIPDDQGCQVKISWQGSSLDSGYHAIEYYSVWRSLPGTDLGWEMIARQPAHHFSYYSITVPTLYDSISLSTGLHYYMISAHRRSANPDLFYDSEPLSGFSIDNLAPAAPVAVMGSIVEGQAMIHWDSSDESDLKYYLVYRSNTPVDDIRQLEPIAATRDTVYTDSDIQSGENYYYIVAQDVHENSSPASMALRLVGPDLIRADDEIPDHFALYQNYPNPFNPYTTIEFDIPQQSRIRVVIFNILGELIGELIDNTLPPGKYRYRWTPDRLPSGLYIFQIRAVSFSAVKKMLYIK